MELARRLPLALALTLPLLVGGCGVPVPLVTAALGFGAATLTFDTEVLRFWEARHPQAPVMGNKP